MTHSTRTIDHWNGRKTDGRQHAYLTDLDQYNRHRRGSAGK